MNTFCHDLEGGHQCGKNYCYYFHVPLFRVRKKLELGEKSPFEGGRLGCDLFDSHKKSFRS